MRLFGKKISCQKVFTAMEMPQWCCDLPWHEVKNYTLKPQRVKDSQLHTQDVTRNKAVEENKDQILNYGQRSWRKPEIASVSNASDKGEGRRIVPAHVYYCQIGWKKINITVMVFSFTGPKGQQQWNLLFVLKCQEEKDQRHGNICF